MTWPRPCAHLLGCPRGTISLPEGGGITRASPMRVNSPIAGIEPVGGAAGRGELAFAPRLAATPCRCLLAGQISPRASPWRTAAVLEATSSLR